MNLLAVESATPFASAALWQDGTVTVRFEKQPRGGGMLALVDALLREASLAPDALEAVAYGAGPGAFTGLRLAAGTAQGMAFGADCPVVGISTLAALAHRAWRELGFDCVVPLLDARMGEVYWGAYRNRDDGNGEPVVADRVSPPASVSPPPGPHWHAVGGGLGAYPQLQAAFAPPGVPELIPSAEDVALLAVARLAAGGGAPPESAVPVYLRDQVIQSRP